MTLFEQVRAERRCPDPSLCGEACCSLRGPVDVEWRVLVQPNARTREVL